MSRHVGRHRAARQSPLRRPAVAATATISAVAVSAAGYAGTTVVASPSDAAAAMSLTSGTTTEQSSAVTTGVVVSDADGTRAARAKAAKARAEAAGLKRANLAKLKSQVSRDSATADRSTRKALVADLAPVTDLRSASAPTTEAEPTENSSSDSDDSSTSASRSSSDSRDSSSSSSASTERESTQETSRDAERPAAVTSGDPRSIARSMLAQQGFGAGQFSCLNSLWMKESGWNPSASNPSSGAYGIPQSLPGSKMASAGADWRTNPATQISWGLSYIKSRYGSPCSAWAHSQAVNWY
ncbi:transglycosylase SLT domain-containing protein [Dermacoccaceae bacterium W4C1]